MSPSPHRARPSPAAVQALARVSVAAGDLIRAERSRRKLTLRALAAHAGGAAVARRRRGARHALPALPVRGASGPAGLGSRAPQLAARGEPHALSEPPGGIR